MAEKPEMTVEYDNKFGVKHYKVKVIKKKENIFKYIVSVLSYAVFIWLLLIGGTLLLYVADIKIRAMKGDNSPPVFNAYVVMSGSMLPTIQVKDIVASSVNLSFWISDILILCMNSLSLGCVSS